MAETDILDVHGDLSRRGAVKNRAGYQDDAEQQLAKRGPCGSLVVLPERCRGFKKVLQPVLKIGGAVMLKLFHKLKCQCSQQLALRLNGLLRCKAVVIHTRLREAAVRAADSVVTLTDHAGERVQRLCGKTDPDAGAQILNQMLRIMEIQLILIKIARRIDVEQKNDPPRIGEQKRINVHNAIVLI